VSPRQAASTLGKIGAARKHQAEREIILERARQMCVAMNMTPPPGLYPPLLLTGADRC
jgi:hypothetical protein